MKKNQLYDLSEEIRKCTACMLWKKRLLAVSGVGEGKIIFVGGAPNNEEDRQGLPFVGEIGKLFDELLKIAEIAKSDTFLTNCVKCHPPLRKPTLAELRTCRELWLSKQISLINPNLVVLLGEMAKKSLLKYLEKEKISYFITASLDEGITSSKVKEKLIADFKKLREIKPEIKYEVVTY